MQFAHSNSVRISLAILFVLSVIPSARAQEQQINELDEVATSALGARHGSFGLDSRKPDLSLNGATLQDATILFFICQASVATIGPSVRRQWTVPPH
jgi:hypothetical protein